jgi:hypothetical protein
VAWRSLTVGSHVMKTRLSSCTPVRYSFSWTSRHRHPGCSFVSQHYVFEVVAGICLSICESMAFENFPQDGGNVMDLLRCLVGKGPEWTRKYVPACGILGTPVGIKASRTNGFHHCKNQIRHKSSSVMNFSLS